MAPEITNEKIYFLGDTSEIISGILKKYQLEETDEELGELAEKMFKEEPEPFVFRGAVILKTAIGLAKKEIAEKDVIVILQKELSVSQPIAEGLTNEIKTKLIPIATKNKPIPEKLEDESSIKTEENKETDIFPNIKPPIGIAEIIGKDALKAENKPNTRAMPPSKKPEKIKKPIMSEENKEHAPKQPKRPDSYREPIE